MNCKVCTNAQGNSFLEVKEMMQGTADIFHYMECACCGCVQLMDAPADMSYYYGKHYYSLLQSPSSLFKPALKRWFKKHRDHYAITAKGIIGNLVNSRMPSPNIELYHLRIAGLQRHFKMLDVGAGAGMLTYILYNAGFKNITGIDPFLPKDIHYENGLVIKRMALEEITENNFDVLFFHHSFEHIAAPRLALEQVYRLLKPGGKCVIRIPTASSYAWQHYRENWVQLDAPRHYFLHTIESLKILTEETGFLFEYLADEGTAFQFTGSEQYKMGIPLHGNKQSYFEGNKDLFTQAQLTSFINQANELNGQRQGDSICIMVKKKM